MSPNELKLNVSALCFRSSSLFEIPWRDSSQSALTGSSCRMLLAWGISEETDPWDLRRWYKHTQELDLWALAERLEMLTQLQGWIYLLRDSIVLLICKTVQHWGGSAGSRSSDYWLKHLDEFLQGSSSPVNQDSSPWTESYGGLVWLNDKKSSHLSSGSGNVIISLKLTNTTTMGKVKGMCRRFLGKNEENCEDTGLHHPSKGYFQGDQLPFRAAWHSSKVQRKQVQASPDYQHMNSQGGVASW